MKIPIVVPRDVLVLLCSQANKYEFDHRIDGSEIEKKHEQLDCLVVTPLHMNHEIAGKKAPAGMQHVRCLVTQIHESLIDDATYTGVGTLDVLEIEWDLTQKKYLEVKEALSR